MLFRSPVETRPVVADDGEPVATLEAEGGEPEGEVADLVVVLAPRERLPDSPVLLAHRRPAAVLLGVPPHLLGERVDGRHTSHVSLLDRLGSRRGCCAPRRACPRRSSGPCRARPRGRRCP